MNKYLVAGMLFLMFSGGAIAQQMPGDGPDQRTRFAPENFQELKARVLQIIEERRTRLEQEKACVEKAGNSEELRKCRPEPRMGRGGMGRPGGPREQRTFPQEQK